MKPEAFLLHTHRYWTEYLDFLFDEFPLISSTLTSKPSYPLFDPMKHKTIISSGRIWDKTDRNRLLIRFLHSPGFGFIPILEGYASLSLFHQNCDYRFIFSEQAYRVMMFAEHLSEAHDFYRYQLMQDKRVSTTQIDLMLYKFLKASKKAKRKEGTGLIALNWNIVFEKGETLIQLFTFLQKELELTIVLHPLTLNYPGFIEAIENYPGLKVYSNLNRDQLIDLYDSHEFILFDGSGAGYEAIIRGCKPLLVNDLHYQERSNTLHAALEMGYLPFQSYREIKQYRPFDQKAFIAQCYPFLSQYTYDQAVALAKKEIISILDEWSHD